MPSPVTSSCARCATEPGFQTFRQHSGLQRQTGRAPKHLSECVQSAVLRGRDTRRYGCQTGASRVCCSDCAGIALLPVRPTTVSLLVARPTVKVGGLDDQHAARTQGGPRATIHVDRIAQVPEQEPGVHDVVGPGCCHPSTSPARNSTLVIPRSAAASRARLSFTPPPPPCRPGAAVVRNDRFTDAPRQGSAGGLRAC